jgi:lipopolysaccharide/colanic/teichoic acid biosynthesis glycosyltransferase
MQLIYKLAIVVLFVVSVPLQVSIAVILLITQDSPVLFAQKRVGQRAKPFILYKFRTMKAGSEEGQSKLRRQNESDGPVFKMYNDPRFTAVGRLLSHTGLDELPQLWNVLRGEMALIGPRPLPIHEAKKLSPWMRVRHCVLPGIISPAILTGRYHESFAAWMRSDVVYAQRKNIKEDALLLMRSVGFMTQLFFKSIARDILHST